MFVLLQNIEHFNSNSARNQNSSRLKEQLKNFSQHFSQISHFRGNSVYDIRKLILMQNLELKTAVHDN